MKRDHTGPSKSVGTFVFALVAVGLVAAAGLGMVHLGVLLLLWWKAPTWVGAAWVLAGMPSILVAVCRVWSRLTGDRCLRLPTRREGLVIGALVLGSFAAWFVGRETRTMDPGGVERTLDGGVLVNGAEIGEDRIIVAGMAARFERILDEAIREAAGGPVTVWLNSNGGATWEANAMADVLRERSRTATIVTRVGPEAQCLSACVPILLAAETRQVHPWSWIMIHRADAAKDLAKRGAVVGQYIPTAVSSPYIRLKEALLPFMGDSVRTRSVALDDHLRAVGVLGAPWYAERKEFWCMGLALVTRYPGVVTMIPGTEAGTTPEIECQVRPPTVPTRGAH